MNVITINTASITICILSSSIITTTIIIISMT